LDSLNETNRQKVTLLRQTILEASPQISESIKYNSLFYNYKGLFCYFWVDAKSSMLYIGFCDGYLMSDPNQNLSTGSTKQIRKLYVDEISPVFLRILRDFLQEAIWVKDTILFKNK
jgi:hypothetical protein